MIIKFKLGDLYEIMDQYCSLFEYAEPNWAPADNGYNLQIDGFRVVIPKMNISFRTGELYVRNEEVDDPDDDEAWEFVHSVDLYYSETEKDALKFLGYGENILYILEELSKANKIAVEDYDSLNCFIDTSEFIDEETVNKLFPKNWKNSIKAKYPDLFKIIKGQKKRLSKEYDKAEIEFYSISLYMYNGYYNCFCGKGESEKVTVNYYNCNNELVYTTSLPDED